MARLTPHRDLTPVVRADVLDDGQSQTGATGGPGARGVHAVEALKDPGLLALGDALALVGDGHFHELFAGPYAHCHSSSRSGVVDRVAYQVTDGGHEQVCVPEA